MPPPMLNRKVEANAYLPRLAEGYVCGELTLDDLVAYFKAYAHLYTVGIDVNAICNLACSYCYLDAYNPTSTPRYADLEYFYRFLSEVSDAGVDLVALVGKEPFADSRGIQLLKFLDQLSDHGTKFRFGVVTNGTLVDRYIDQLPRSVAYVDISLDGCSRTNDAVRGHGVFRRAAANVRLLKDSGFPVWISSVLHTGNHDPVGLKEFLRVISSEYGCGRFYFSPVRNFTGGLQPFLLSFAEISRVQDHLTALAETLPGVEVVILDHPYEAVWRDYFWQLRAGKPSRLDGILVDAFGNVLERLGSHCYRKLDVFPHGPWGTCRIDARGEYLPDVETRTYSVPPSMGSIRVACPNQLQKAAIDQYLRPMISGFLEHMQLTGHAIGNALALNSLSVPVTWSPGSLKTTADLITLPCRTGSRPGGHC